MAIGIYKITSPSGKVYIGQSVDIDLRFQSYRNCGSNIKNQTVLYYSFMKHGVDNHVFEVVEECKVEELNSKERYWQDYYNVISDGLNSRLQASEDKSGFLSEETIDRISTSKKGSIPWNKGKKTGQDVVNKRIILDTYSGIYYLSIKEAAETNNIKRTTLNAMLCGQNPNKTNMIYV